MTGRLQDLLARDHLSSQKLKMIVMDEADKLINPTTKMYKPFKWVFKNCKVVLYKQKLPGLIKVINKKVLLLLISYHRIATLPGNLEKHGNWQFRHKNLEFWTKITEKPWILNKLYMLSSKILSWHKKSII